MSSIKQKTVSGLFWTSFENIANQLSQFVVGIILARILSPTDYGLVGMIMVFVVISQAFVDSGLGQALIQKKDATDNDYSTVFLFNITTSTLFYLGIFASASYISAFYEQEIIADLLRVIALVLIIDSIALIQRTKLTKDLNFKSLTKISVTASVISGIAGIGMAMIGFGVWTLIFKTLFQHFLMAFLFYVNTKWFPKLVFDKQSFKSLFSFSYKLLLSGLINSFYENIYVFIIGKIFSPADLGFFSRANQFKDLASKNLTSTLQKVTFPVLSKLQDDSDYLYLVYRKIIRVSLFVTSFTMAVLFVTAEPLIIILIGKKWSQSVGLLQLLCFVGLLYPIHAINLNLLVVKRRSDLFLRLEIIKKVVGFPVIIGMSFLGIKYMIIGSICTSFIAFGINTYYTGQLISYSSVKQFWDIFPSVILASTSAFLTFLITITLPDNLWLELVIQLILMTSFYILGSVIFRFREYYEIKAILLGYLKAKTVIS